jgi:ATPase subunit of ABC transporter with duplicated ATPase domains
VPPDDARVPSLSGGEKRRVALCRLLLEQPDVLLLDEPTNHLDASSVAWLERFLKEYKGTVVAITHDRYFLDNVAGWILEIDRGAAYPYQGNYSVWLEKKAARLDVEKKQERKRAKAMEEELAWIRQGVKVSGRTRASPSQGRRQQPIALFQHCGRYRILPGVPGVCMSRWATHRASPPQRWWRTRRSAPRGRS